MEKKTIKEFIEIKNNEKKLFTAGPASLAKENIFGLEPCFGRGDKHYTQIEDRVLSKLKTMSGHNFIARLQGSGSMALEVMINNIAHGNVLIIDTGYYAQRAEFMAKKASSAYKYIAKVDVVDWSKFDEINGSYDWVITCYTETSIGLKLDVSKLRTFSNRLGAKLMLDATASIGLEDNHDLADAISYSSCKGLFGLTGAGFIAFNEIPDTQIDSFNLSLTNHIEKKMTGPYHAICSLDHVLNSHQNLKEAVEICKENFLNKFETNIYFPKIMQPKLCTRLHGNIVTNDINAVLYTPRTLEPNESVVCHLGEVHLGNKANGKINECLSLS